MSTTLSPWPTCAALLCVFGPGKSQESCPSPEVMAEAVSEPIRQGW